MKGGLGGHFNTFMTSYEIAHQVYDNEYDCYNALPIWCWKNKIWSISKIVLKGPIRLERNDCMVETYRGYARGTLYLEGQRG